MKTLDIEQSITFKQPLKTMDPRDVFRFMSDITLQITNTISGKLIKCLINDVTEVNDIENSLMKTINVNYIVTSGHEKWKGTWLCYRAISFACINVETKLFKQSL